jgi:tetratricopeptide (TPR) repeat protein
MGEQQRGVDFFVSYTAADQAWAEWIAWQLEEAGYRTVVQAWDFRPGENFLVQMRRALDAAERTVAVVSAAYLESVYGSDEWTAAFVHDHADTTGLLLVRVEPVSLPRLLRPWIYIDLAGLDAEAATAALLAGLERGRRKPNQPPAFPQTTRPEQAPSFPVQGPTISNLPPRNLTFTGRDGLLERMHQQLDAGDTRSDGPMALLAGALYGLGGVGKTQLALEYAHRYGADYDLVWWIPSENPLLVPTTLARLAARLGLPSVGDQEQVAAAALEELRGRDRWLLVFDNADEPETVARWQPAAGGGRLLVTSRNPAWGALAQPIRVEVLDRAEAVRLLLRRAADQDHAAADQLAEQLGDLPLALEQAAAYLEQTGMPLGAYLAAYRRRHQQLLTKGRPVAYQGQVDTTWQLSLDQLSPAAIALLELCAFLAPEAIPLDLFSAAPDRLPAALATAVAEDGDLAVQEAVGACYRYSLVARDRTGLRVHRLVQQLVRAHLADRDRQERISTVVELLAAGFPPASDQRDPAPWPRCAQLLPHVLVAADHAQAAETAAAGTASILARAGSYLHLRRRAEYMTARGLLERALAIQLATLGADHPQVAATLHSLGFLLRDQGDLAGARARLERALAIQKATLGPNHAEVGLTLETLGRVLRDQGELATARAQLERGDAILRAALGPDNRWVGRNLDYLGLVLRDQGDLAGARARLEQALTIEEAALGPEHPWVGRILGDLGAVQGDQGNLAGGRVHLERALAIYEPTFGTDHPHVGGILEKLGRLLHAQGNLVGARAHLERALVIFETAVGSDHPWVGGTLDSLGHVLCDQGELVAGRAYLDRAHAVLKAALGPEYRDNRAVARRLEGP